MKHESNIARKMIRENRAEIAEQQERKPELTTCNCRWDGKIQVQQCTLHNAHVEAIHDWAERAKTAEAKLNAQQERKPPLDTELFGVRDGVWVSMGMIATPPAMKAREIVRETFGPTTEDGCTDADICFDAMQQLIAHMVASGWKMAQQERKPMMYERKKELVSNWFAEDWAQEKALEMLDDYDTMAQQERKPMNEYDISELMRSGAYMDGPTEFIRAIEAFHGIGDKP